LADFDDRDAIFEGFVSLELLFMFLYNCMRAFLLVESDLPFIFNKQETYFVMLDKHDNGSISYKGYCIDLLNELARILHFTYEIYPVPDGKFGAKTENGSWNGVVGELVKQVCDALCFSLPPTVS